VLNEIAIENEKMSGEIIRYIKKGRDRMVNRIVKFVAMGLLIGAVTCMAEPTKTDTVAVASAGKWLVLVDEGKYAESWTEASELFKNAVKAEEWEKAVLAVRTPLGKLVSRTMKSATYATTLPGAPDGQYIVIEFETVFENKNCAVETVTPMLDKDGQWRVSGYFIK